MTTADERDQALDISRGKPEYFPFLDLPRELRNSVYIKLLKGPDVSPPFFPDVSEGDCKKIGDGSGPVNSKMYAPFPEPICFPPSLLFVNHQVHGEVKELFSKSRPLIYELDCLAVMDGRLYPTWLSVPFLSSHVDIVEVNLRLLMRRWLLEECSRRQVNWVSWMVNRFLSMSRGTEGLPASTNCTTIGRLVLNVVVPSLEEEFALYAGRRLSFGEIVAVWVGNFIERLLADADGWAIRETVGAIWVQVNGEDRLIFDVSQAK